jgi:hypothetical protein
MLLDTSNENIFSLGVEIQKFSRYKEFLLYYWCPHPTVRDDFNIIAFVLMSKSLNVNLSSLGPLVLEIEF